MAKQREYQALDAALCEASWQWLNNNHPAIAQAVETEVNRGATPYEIRRHVVARTQRVELALRCEQAAQFLMGE